MNTSMTAIAAATCTLLLLSLFGAGGPAHATEATQVDQVDAAIDSAADHPATGPIADAEQFSRDGAGTLTYTNDAVSVTVEANDDASILLDASSYDRLSINAGLEGEAVISDDGTAVWTSDAGYSTAPLPQSDGSVQIITVIERADAPENYTFVLNLDGGLTLVPDVGSGAVQILDVAGEYAGSVAPPWAYDASGDPVPTHFEINGNELVQIVNHSADDFDYPITADPYLGRQLFQWISVDHYNNDIRVNLQPTDFGRRSAPWVMTGAGWSEATNWGGSVPGYLNSKATLRQQFDCHAFGNAAAGVWNLERFRPNRTVDWTWGVVQHHCNWTTSNGL